VKPTKNHEALARRYAALGVDVTRTVTTADGDLIADGFRCRSCGVVFLPDTARLRNRHRCPNGCNNPGVGSTKGGEKP
jgi:hypothetical protein